MPRAAVPTGPLGNGSSIPGILNVATKLIILGIYLLAARLVVRWLSGSVREFMFVIINLAAFYRLYMYSPDAAGHDHGLAAGIVYLIIIPAQYVVLRLCFQRPRLAGIAPVMPLLVLVYARFLPPELFFCLPTALFRHLTAVLPLDLGAFGAGLVGISYLAFRSSRLAVEVGNGLVEMPGLWEYLGFCFFVPTALIGPINSYRYHRQGFTRPPPEISLRRAWMRIVVGWVKYQFFSLICNRLTYEGFILNGHPHHWIDLPIAAIFYYLYLYCNFSGFCDMVIGASGLIGIPVLENFDNPFSARNLREYWNRWHITLSTYMRDFVFSPLSKFLVRGMGNAQANHAIALTVLVVFLLIGLWHGTAVHFVLYGLAQGLGMVTVHYYSIFLKRRLGRDGFKAYQGNRWIQAIAVATTFGYNAATLFFFANSIPRMQAIFATLR